MSFTSISSFKNVSLMFAGVVFMLASVFFMQPVSVQAQSGDSGIDPEILADILCAVSDLSDNDIYNLLSGLGYRDFDGCDSESRPLEISDVQTDIDVELIDGRYSVGTYKIEFDVTALEEDAYIHQAAHSVDSPFIGGINFSILGYPEFVGDFTANMWSTADKDGYYWVIEEGDTEQIELTVELDNETGVNGLYRVGIDAIQVNTRPGGQPQAMQVFDVETNRVSLQGLSSDYPDIQYTSPASGDEYEPGDMLRIRYNALNFPQDFNVEMYLVKEDRDLQETIILYGPGSEGDGSFDWRLPENLPDGNDYRVYMGTSYPSTELGPNYYSDYFRISGESAPSSISELSISTGSSVVQGTSVGPITWDSKNIDRVDVLVCYETSSRDRCLYAQRNIVDKESWQQVRVGTNIPVGSDAYIKVRKAGDNSVAVESETFEVVAPEEDVDANIRINNLDGNIWYSGDSKMIEWDEDAFSTDQVDIIVCRGGCWVAARAIDNEGVMVVEIDEDRPLGDNYHVRIREPNDASTVQESDTFEVARQTSARVLSPTSFIASVFSQLESLLTRVSSVLAHN